jgi:crossover junction endodeoxyribonuclease RusA
MPDISVQLPWPESALSPNSRDRWAKIAAAKSARMIGKCAVLEETSYNFSPPLFMPETRLQISYIFHPPTRRHFDLDGLITRCKNYQDGIFDAIQNNDNQIEMIEARLKDVVHGGLVTITISEVTD